jgi:hypothetical protein
VGARDGGLGNEDNVTLGEVVVSIPDQIGKERLSLAGHMRKETSFRKHF